MLQSMEVPEGVATTTAGIGWNANENAVPYDRATYTCASSSDSARSTDAQDVARRVEAADRANRR